MAKYETPGIVLSVQPYRESSVLVRLLSRDHGLLGAIARGVHGKKSNLAAVLQPYYTIQAYLSKRNPDAGGLAQLTAADALYVPEFVRPGVGGDALARMAWAGVFAEILTYSLENDPHSHELYALSRDFFQGLGVVEYPGSFALSAYYALLTVLGYMPEIPPTPDEISASTDRFYIDLQDGSLKPWGAILEVNRFEIDRQALDRLREILYAPENRDAQVVNRRVGRVLARLALALFQSHLERSLHSVRFLEEMVLGA